MLTFKKVQFDQSMAKVLGKAKEKPLLWVKETLQEVNNEIIADTPVDTGNMKASYYAAIGQIPAGPPGSGTTAVNGVLAGLRLGDTYYMGNTAEYSRRMELGFVGEDSMGRNYNQRGRFWIHGVVSRINVISSAVAQRIANRS